MAKKKKTTPQCATCGRWFVTPDQLTYHQRETGHAAPPSKETTTVPHPKPGSIETHVNPSTQSVDLPRIDETSNFVKFGHPFERGGQGDQVAGTLYVPKKLAKGVTHLRVTLMKS